MVGSLASRQAELVAALVAGGPPPSGFAPGPLAAARAALLRTDGIHRVGRSGRPTGGGLRDGWDLARALHARTALPAQGADELAVREAEFRYDAHRAPRRRRSPRHPAGRRRDRGPGRRRAPAAPGPPLNPTHDPGPPLFPVGRAGAGSSAWISD
ncbi:hypothetical protein [Verrucosispora sioxanthis]|uniref:hypothetical protein n=1 Tax=Verrucosispora sioxanthis TaxID=2499994 RepID=UPI0035A056B4